MRIILLFCCISFSITTLAGKVSGVVTDNNKQPLPFSSITVKGTARGTSANSLGTYSLLLVPGEYTLVCQHVSYKSVEQKVTVVKADIQVNFKLAEQQYELGNVIVKNGEDPAYTIIRKAIEKRPYYEKEIKKFQAEVYIKGQMQLRDFPNVFLVRRLTLKTVILANIKWSFFQKLFQNIL